MIAALYVETGGVYYGLDDVDPWDEQRDARLYRGPWPVVAHPPCARWSRMVESNPQIRGLRGQDGGCFAAALAAVRQYGGILEHPAGSSAWTTFGLPTPARFGWTATFDDPGYASEVDQAAYGFPAPKRTWLYYVGLSPPALRWGERGEPTRNVRNMASDGSRSRTPLAFRDALLACVTPSRTFLARPLAALEPERADGRHAPREPTGTASRRHRPATQLELSS